MSNWPASGSPQNRPAASIRPVESEGDEPLPLLHVPENIDERVEHFQARATKEGKKAQDLAKEVLHDAGFEIVAEKVKVKGTGLQLNFEVADQDGEYRYYVDMSGAFTSSRPGLMRTDTLWKMLGRANVLKTTHPDTRLLVLTSHLPRPSSEGDRAMRAVGPWALFDAIEIFDDPADDLGLAGAGTAAGVQRLRSYASAVPPNHLRAFGPKPTSAIDSALGAHDFSRLWGRAR